VSRTRITSKVIVSGRRVVAKTEISYGQRRMGQGFPTEAVLSLLSAARRKGYVTKTGKLDFKRLGRACGVSWRMLYYAATGSDLSLKRVMLLAECVGYDVVVRKKAKPKTVFV